MVVAEKWISRWLESKQLTVDKNRCTHVKNQLSTCNRCVESCPGAAIEIDSNLKVDFEKCVECMVCTTVCPTAVFIDKNYKKYFEQMDGRDIIEIGCQKQAETNQGITIPCLQSLDETMLLYALNQNKKIYIKHNESSCEKCAYQFENISSDIEELINKVRHIKGNDSELYINYNDESVGGQQQFSRRDLFSFFTKRIQSNLVSPLIEEEEITNKEREKIDLSQKRQLFNKLIYNMSSSSDSLISINNCNSTRVNINELCTGCLKCTQVCPTGALYFKEDEEYMLIKQNLQDCVNCKSCEEVCGAKALSLSNEPVLLSDYFSEQSRLVYRYNKKYCKMCGETITEQTQVLCIDCDNKQKQEDAFLSFW